MLNRRIFVSGSVLGALSLSLLKGQSQPAAESTEVETPCGRLRGRAIGNVRMFFGIPFAKPPVGSLRFLAPEPVAPWRDTREATSFAPAAMQAGSNLPQSEDCLYLNIWAPAGKGPYPVFVWIHGGGYTAGRSSDSQFDGTRFAEQGIITVTIAYRLGIFGFLDLEPLLGQRYAGSANNAVGDVITALTWIKENIASFGGDAGQVTVGGESAGAKLVGTLLGIPAAVPLFQQAISESGGAERVATASAAREVSLGFGSIWTHKFHRPVSDLTTASGAELIRAQTAFLSAWPKHFPLRPALDDRLIHKLPIEVIHEGSTKGKRILIGTNRDESSSFIGPHPESDISAKDLSSLSVERFRAIEAKYGTVYPGMSASLLRIRSLSAEEYWVPSVRLAETASNTGARVYMYRLDFPGKDRFQGLAFHGLDLRFVWDRFPQAIPSLKERAFAATVHGAWVSFLRQSVPAASELTGWPLYELPERKTMILNEDSHIESNPNAAELALWNGVL